MNPQTEKDSFAAFLAKKCENVKIPFVRSQLIKEYCEITGSSSLSTQTFSQMHLRVPRTPITNPKIKRLFGLSIPIDTNCLRKIRRRGKVELDQRQRIIKYVAYNGSLELDAGHGSGSRISLGSEPKQKSELVKIASDLMEKESRKRSIPCSKERKEAVPAASLNNSDILDVSSELYPFEVDAPVETSYLLNFEQKQQYFAPQEEFKPEIFSINDDVTELKTQNEIISLLKQKKFLEAIEDLILTLKLPVSAKLQNKIEKTIENIDINAYIQQKITSDELETAAASCVLIVTRSASVAVDVDSINLCYFLLLLRNAIISLRIPSFNNFQETLHKNISECQGKRVPFEKVEFALSTIINIVAP